MSNVASPFSVGRALGDMVAVAADVGAGGEEVERGGMRVIGVCGECLLFVVGSWEKAQARQTWKSEGGVRWARMRDGWALSHAPHAWRARPSAKQGSETNIHSLIRAR
jgi:hypothetical protein